MKSRLVVFTLFGFMLAGSIQADPASPSSKTVLAQEFLDLVGATDGVNKTIDSVDTFFLPSIRPGSQIEGISISSPDFWKAFKKDQAANLQALKLKLRDVMLKPVMAMTEEELKESIRFYRSPTGKKVLEVFYDQQGLFEIRAKTLVLITDMVKSEAHLLAQAKAQTNKAPQVKKKGQ